MVKCSSFYDNKLDIKTVNKTDKFIVSHFADGFDDEIGPVPTIIDCKIMNDNRGYFYESFNLRDFRDATDIYDFAPVQDNESYSKNGTIRGFHFQEGESAQAKLVRVVKGAVWDVVLDIRRGSITFGKFAWVFLSAENKRQFYVPKGFAHAFCVVSEDAVFQYKVDNYYDKKSEDGFNPKSFDWNILIDYDSEDDIIMSEKDLSARFFDMGVEPPSDAENDWFKKPLFLKCVKIDGNGNFVIDEDLINQFYDYITTSTKE